jgi:hypothetical protein
MLKLAKNRKELRQSKCTSEKNGIVVDCMNYNLGAKVGIFAEL